VGHIRLAELPQTRKWEQVVGLLKRDGDAPAIAAVIRIRQSVTFVVFRHRIERQKQSIISTTGEQTHEVHATALLEPV